MNPTYPLVPIANFIACILVLVSLSRNMFQSWNVGVCSFAVWTAIMSFATAVDSIIWADTIKILVPVWCDIVTHIQIGSLVAVPVASFVIIRRLSLVMRQLEPVQKKKQSLNLLVDLFLCLGIPGIQMALFYAVQCERFAIVEEYGCTANAVNAGLSIILLCPAATIFPILSLTLYSPRLIRTYFEHKKLVFLFSSGSNSDRQYFRKLLALGLFDIFITLPIAIYQLVQGLSHGGIHDFWPGWKTAHSEISSISIVSSEEWKSHGTAIIVAISFNQWVHPLYAIVFFALFGLTQSNRLWYWNVFWKVMKPFGFTPRQDLEASSIAFGSGLPVVNVPRATHLRNQPSAVDSNTLFQGRSFNDCPESFGVTAKIISLTIMSPVENA